MRQVVFIPLSLSWLSGVSRCSLNLGLKVDIGVNGIRVLARRTNQVVPLAFVALLRLRLINLLVILVFTNLLLAGHNSIRILLLGRVHGLRFSGKWTYRSRG